MMIMMMMTPIRFYDNGDDDIINATLFVNKKGSIHCPGVSVG